MKTSYVFFGYFEDSIFIGSFFVVFWIFMFISYFTPSAVAIVRGHQRVGMVIAANTLLGWTCILWAVVLFWAMTGRQHQCSPLSLIHQESEV